MTKAAAVKPAANCALPARLRRDERRRGHPERERGYADQDREGAPEDKQHADEIDVEARGARCHRRRSRKGKRSSATTIVTSTRMTGACGERTRKRKRAPSTTPGGTGTRRPVARDDRRRRSSPAGLGPHFAASAADAAGARSGTPSGTMVPIYASRLESRTESAADLARRGCVAEKRVAHALDDRPIDGKSIAISSRNGSDFTGDSRRNR